jgi:hypothetical protein
MLTYCLLRWNPTRAQVITVSEGLLNLTSSSFVPSHPTKFIIHGYSSNKDLDTLVDIRKGEQSGALAEVCNRQVPKHGVLFYP